MTERPAPSPILDAVYRGDDARLMALLARGPAPDPDPTAEICDGKTAPAIAEERGARAVARRLRAELP